jgi:hypothetical protein
MATGATVHHTRMIESRTQPTCRGVADITRRRCRNMGCTHTGCNHTVMTRCATARDLCMIHQSRRRPARAIMAGLTNIRGRNMRSWFAGSDNTFVTG